MKPIALARAIVASVADKHHLQPDTLYGPVREERIVRARHEAMARVRDDLKYSYWQIGHLFDRCHDTVLRGIRRHRAGHPKKKYVLTRPRLPRAPRPRPNAPWVDHMLKNIARAEAAAHAGRVHASQESEARQEDQPQLRATEAA